MVEEYQFPCVECVDFDMKTSTKIVTIHVCVLYRHPSTSVLEFVNNMSTYFEVNINRTNDLIIEISISKWTCQRTMRPFFCKIIIMDSFDLKNF